MAMTVESRVLSKIRPSPELISSVFGTSRELLDLVKLRTQDIEGIWDVRLVGSVAKNTYLNDPDIDIFILFNEDVPRKKLETVGLSIGRSILNDQEERYAEHPYLHGTYNGFDVDLVPCYHITDSSKIRTAVDRTPFHTEYIISTLKEEQQDDVRLLKKFMKGIGTYGAEAKVQGFSGYLVELLVIRLGGFRAVMEDAAKWRYGVTFDLIGNGAGGFRQPLVFYDPVDPGRNVASALSQQKFALFIQACKDYLASPSDRYFFPNPREPLGRGEIEGLLHTIGMDLIGVVFERPDLIDDNLHPQAKKSLDGMSKLLEMHDFTVLDRDYHVGDDRVTFMFQLAQERLGRGKKHIGPPIWIENSMAFLDRWQDRAIVKPYIEDGRWVAVVPRPHTSAIELLRAEMRASSLGSSFKERRFEVLSHYELLSRGMNVELSQMLDKRLPWTIE